VLDVTIKGRSIQSLAHLLVVLVDRPWSLIYWVRCCCKAVHAGASIGSSRIGVMRICLVFANLRPLVWNFWCTLTNISQSGPLKKAWRMAHWSDVAKSTREQCIHMAAIVIVTMVGIWNWNSGFPIDRIALLCGTIVAFRAEFSSTDVLFTSGWERENITIQHQNSKHLGYEAEMDEKWLCVTKCVTSARLVPLVESQIR